MCVSFDFKSGDLDSGFVCESTHLVGLLNRFGQKNGFQVLLSVLRCLELKKHIFASSADREAAAAVADVLVRSLSHSPRIWSYPFARHSLLPKLRELAFPIWLERCRRRRVAASVTAVESDELWPSLRRLHENRFFHDEWLLLRRDRTRILFGTRFFVAGSVTATGSVH